MNGEYEREHADKVLLYQIENLNPREVMMIKK
jgi:hypothetical protein